MDRTRLIGWIWVTVQFAILAALLVVPWQLHAPILLSTGGLLGVCGGLLALSVSRTLGEAFTPTPVPRTGAHLSTGGPYRYLRHPMYVGILLLVLGALIAAGTWPGWIVGGVLAVFFVLKSRWEDRQLAAAYGADWQAWAARTGAFWPRGGASDPAPPHA